MSMAEDEELIRLHTRELEVELWKHAGRWVAITRSELIAAGDSADEVLAEAERKGWAREDYVLDKLLEPGKLYVI